MTVLQFSFRWRNNANFDLGGTAILNLMLNLVVFFTALFYLLSSKSSTYKPVELFNRYAPKVGGSSPNAKNLARAVEEAVNGVFTASFKMAAFYGMWTWLIHTLFQVKPLISRIAKKVCSSKFLF